MSIHIFAYQASSAPSLATATALTIDVEVAPESDPQAIQMRSQAIAAARDGDLALAYSRFRVAASLCGSSETALQVASSAQEAGLSIAADAAFHQAIALASTTARALQVAEAAADHRNALAADAAYRRALDLAASREDLTAIQSSAASRQMKGVSLLARQHFRTLESPSSGLLARLFRSRRIA